MQKIILFFTSILLIQPAHARNIALIIGGSDQEHEGTTKNIFIDDMSSMANGLHNKEWETHVLYDSDFDFKEWDAFKPELRPKVKGDPKKQFSLKNVNAQLDTLIKSNLGPKDQVLINLQIHGGVFNDKHIIGWGDTRKAKLSDLFVELGKAYFNPSKDIFKKVETLLQKNVKVYLPIRSCYSGQLLKDLQPLLKKYPNNLCITTSTSSDRTSLAGSDSKLHTSIIESDGKSSIYSLFRENLNPDGQISSLSSFMQVQERFKQIDYANDQEDKIANNLCLLNNEITQSPLTRSQKEFIKFGTLLPLSQQQLDINRLKKICTDEYSDKVVNDYHDELNKRDERPTDGDKYLNVKFTDLPSLHHVKTDKYSDSVQWHSFKTSFYEDGSMTSGDDTLMTADNFAQFLIFSNEANLTEKDKKAIKEIHTLLDKNSKFKKRVLQSVEELKKIKDHFNSKLCNRRVFENALIKFKQALLDEAKNEPGSKACQNFKI